MAVHYWDGSTDTDWATAANWTAALPAADGEVIFDSRQVTAPTTGMSDGAANNSGHADQCTFDLLHFKKGYTGGIGTAALPLVCAPDKIIIDGSGTYHICCGGTDQSTDKAIPLTFINNKDATVYLYSNCNDGANLCAFTSVYVTGGTVYLAFYSADTDDQGCYVQSLYLAPKNNSSSEVTVTMEKDAYDVLNSVATNVYMQNGTLLCDSMLGVCNMWNGIIYYGSEVSTGTAVTEADMNITSLRQMGGTFYWNPDDTGDPTITSLFLLGGTFNASSSVSNDIAKVITTTYLFKGATMDVANGRGNITLTNLYRMGGTLTVDEWAKIAVTYDQA
jgi:hypothetical protein